MSEYMVEVGLDLNATQYVTTMGQAINLTKQYSDVAGGLPGAVQNLSKSMVNATMAVTGFNKVNGVALDTAAAYQKQLSLVEARTRITGQSFEKLAKTTKGWAREFPIGMGEATKVMESLQQQGVKSEKQMASLGKSFIQLGAATGTSASAMGSEFLSLSRTMGNGINQFQKLSDSLVSTTAKIGGSAPAVVAFSKALAPVASTVGLSQTAVIGLSSAMSKLGEDGYQAANSFNKVLLDMNRAIRDGGPELKAYADLLGTTTDRLKSMFKMDPAEVLAQFSEAVAKAGPDISRTLDALGFDSVRTTRSLTALARGGGPRQAIDTAIESYGDGSTAKAAEAALDGVSDQAERLRETMAQVVSDVGQPLLGFTKGVLSGATNVAQGVQNVTGSGPGQAVFGAAGVGSAVASVAGSVVNAAAIASLGAVALKWFKGSDVYQNYKQGVADAKAGAGAPTRPGFGAAAGFARQASMMGLYSLGAGASTEGSGGGFGRLANRLSGFAMEGGARLQASTANMFSALGAPGPRIGVTPEMQELRNRMNDDRRMILTGMKTMDRDAIGQGFRNLGANVRAYGGTYDVGAARGAANLAAASIWTPVRAGAGLAAGGLRAAGAAASALGFTPAGAAVMGGLIGGGAIYGQLSSQQQGYDMARERSRELNNDVYTRFNSFAEATGQAGKGIVSFSAQVAESTQRIMQANTTFDQAFKLNTQERTLARSAGYNPAIDFMGDNATAESLFTNIVSTLGPQAAPADIARVIADVENKNQSQTEAVTRLLRDFYGENGQTTQGIDYKQLAQNLADNRTLWDDIFGSAGVNETQGDIASQAVSYAGMRAAQQAERYGGTVAYEGGQIAADEATRLLEARRLITSQDPRTLDRSAGRALTGSVADILGVDEETANKMGLGTGYFDSGLFYGQKSGQDAFESFLRANPDVASKYQALDRTGSSISETGDVQLGQQFATQRPIAQVETETFFKSFEKTTGVTSALGNAMTDLTDVVLTYENALRNTQPGMTPGAAEVGKGDRALLEFAKDMSSSGKRQAAVESILDRLVKVTEGDYAAAKQAATYAFEQAGTGTAAKEAFAGVLEQLGVRQGMTQAGRSPILDLVDTIRSGQQAQVAPRNSNTTAASTQIVLAGQQAQGQVLSQLADFNRGFGALQTGINATRRSAGVSIGQVRAQLAMGLERSSEDYALQRQYAREDRSTMRARQTRDFGISQDRARMMQDRQMSRAQEDYDTSRARAVADFNKQMTRNEADFNVQRTRMAEDYNKGRERATRDYNLSIARATRDFQIGQARSQEDFDRSQLRALTDFNKSRSRMMEDYNKQVRRMGEDSARAMYDPFKRIQAQMVMDAGQLISNLEDQTEAINKQMGNLSQARSMGLSEQAIKALNLADASNAQQLSRLVGDLAGNQDLVAQVNEAVASKGTASTALMQDSGNVQFSRMAEDFATQLSRAEEDFAVASSRSTEDFNIGMSRAVADFSKQMSDAAQDFATQMSDSDVDFAVAVARMNADFKTATVRMSEDFNTSLTYMEADFKKMVVRAREDFATQMKFAAEDFKRQVEDQEFDFKKMDKRAREAFEKTTKRMKEDADLQIRGIGAGAAAAIQSMEESFYGMLQNSDTGLKAAMQFIEIIKGSKIPLEQMSDDVQAMYAAATDLVNKANGRVSPDRIDRPRASMPDVRDSFRQTKLDGKAAAESFLDGWDMADWNKLWARLTGIVTMNPLQLEPAGREAFNGFKAGWESASGDGWWQQVWEGFVGSVKGWLGIASPSKVFAGIGSNVVDGLREGIEATIGGVWDKLIDPLKSLDVLGAVKDAFASTQSWLGNLGSTLTDWLAGGWDDLGKPLENLDLEKKLKDAFKPVTTFLEGLGGEEGLLPSIMKPAWMTIPESFPTVEEMLAYVQAPFTSENGIFAWLTSLGGSDGLLAKAMPAVEEIEKAFDVLRRGFSNIMHEIVNLWNSLDLDINIKIPLIKIAGFSVPAFETPLGGFPGFSWPGADVGGQELKTGDLIPDIKDNPFQKYAMGGIAYGAQKAWIGEAGYPEAVIPLNARGAEVLASTMARYVDSTSVQASGMERYATHVSNTYYSTQDYSTQFNGAITVQAQNPDEMAQRLAARARRQALAQPIRGRA